MPFTRFTILGIIYLFVSSCLLVPAVLGSSDASYPTLKAVVKKYKKSEMIQMDVVKVVKSELMGKETKYTGVIIVASGVFRWENKEPEKTLLVFDGTTIWNEQSPPEEFPGPVQVFKAKLDKKNRAQILVSSLLGDGSLFENFKILNESKDGDDITYKIEPKTAELNIKDLQLKTSKAQKEVREISYSDDVGNVTSMKFSKVEFKKKKDKNLFKYTPPKGTQVINL